MQQSERRHQPDDDGRHSEGSSEEESPAALAIPSVVQRAHQPLEARLRVETNRRNLHPENATDLAPGFELPVLSAELFRFVWVSIHRTS